MNQISVVHGRFLVAVRHPDPLSKQVPNEASQGDWEQDRHARAEQEGDEDKIAEASEPVVNEEEWTRVNRLKLLNRCRFRVEFVARTGRLLVYAP